MKPARGYAIVLVTAPDIKTARLLVRRALEKRLVACGNIIPKVESHYWWQGKLEKSPEVLIIFKTAAGLLDELERLIIAHHPYDTPEVITLSLTRGSAKYLNWIQNSVV